jgi:hypothetical protein
MADEFMGSIIESHRNAYGVAICCLLECWVFIFDIVRIWRGEHE